MVLLPPSVSSKRFPTSLPGCRENDKFVNCLEFLGDNWQVYRIEIISYKAVGKIGSELIHSLNLWALIMNSSDEISHFCETGDACVEAANCNRKLNLHFYVFLAALGWGLQA